MRLRSVELELPDVAAAAEFLERLWGLVPVSASGAARFFRGTGDHPYILSLTKAAAPAVAAITFAGSEEEITALGKPDRAFDVPGGGERPRDPWAGSAELPLRRRNLESRAVA